MGGMKKNGRDYYDTEGSFEPDFLEVLRTLNELCRWHLWPEMMPSSAGRAALERAWEVIGSYDGFLPDYPSEQDAREADAKWRTDPSEEF